jgi:hypothetical protein
MSLDEQIKIANEAYKKAIDDKDVVSANLYSGIIVSLNVKRDYDKGRTIKKMVTPEESKMIDEYRNAKT